jgi:hypothetical protein
VLFSSYIDDIAFTKFLCKQRWFVMHCVKDGVSVFRSCLRRCGGLIMFDLAFLICWGLLFTVNWVFSVFRCCLGSIYLVVDCWSEEIFVK